MGKRLEFFFATKNHGDSKETVINYYKAKLKPLAELAGFSADLFLPTGLMSVEIKGNTKRKFNPNAFRDEFGYDQLTLVLKNEFKGHEVYIVFLVFFDDGKFKQSSHIKNIDELVDRIKKGL